MNATELALVVIAKKLNAPALPPGTHHVRGFLTVEVDAEIIKGEPVSYVPTAALPLKEMLAIALHKSGVQAANIDKEITDLAIEALSKGDPVKLTATERGLKAVEKMLGKLPEKVREGATKITGTVRAVKFEAFAEEVRHVA